MVRQGTDRCLSLNHQVVVLALLILSCGCGRLAVPPQNSAIDKPETRTFEDLIRHRLPTGKLLSIKDRGRPAGVDYLGNIRPAIESTFGWTFQSDTFSITSESEPLPELLVRMIFERGDPVSSIYDSAHPVKHIEGKWELRSENELLLRDVKTDYGVMPYVKLEIYHPSPTSIYISGAGDAEILFEVDAGVGN